MIFKFSNNLFSLMGAIVYRKIRELQTYGKFSPINQMFKNYLTKKIQLFLQEHNISIPQI